MNKKICLLALGIMMIFPYSVEAQLQGGHEVADFLKIFRPVLNAGDGAEIAAIAQEVRPSQEERLVAIGQSPK